MHLPFSYGSVLALFLVATPVLLVACLQIAPSQLGLLLFSGLFLLGAIVVGFSKLYVNCPRCGGRAIARVTYGYHAQYGRNSNQLAPKLACPECGLLVRTSDFPSQFEPDRS